MKMLIYIVSSHSMSKKQVNVDDYSIFSIKSWKLYCEKYNIDLYVEYENPAGFDEPIWNKSLIYKHDGYDFYGIIDADTIVSPNSPDIRNIIDVNKLNVVSDYGDLNWIIDSIECRKHLFEFELNIDKYFNAGVLFFPKKYLSIFEKNLEFYTKHRHDIDSIKTGGKEQTLLNYIVQVNNIEINFLPESWNLFGLFKRELNRYNWQLNDNTLWLYKYGYIIHFTGFDIENRVKIMENVYKYWYAK